MLPGFDDCSFEDNRPRHDPQYRLSDSSDERLRAHLYPDTRGDVASDELEILALNLSRRAIGMELPHDVPVGAVYTLKIGTGGDSVQSQVRIISCDPIADGLYRAGGEFC